MFTAVPGGPCVLLNSSEHGSGGYFSGCGQFWVPCRLKPPGPLLGFALLSGGGGDGFAATLACAGALAGTLADADPPTARVVVVAKKAIRDADSRRLLIKSLQWAVGGTVRSDPIG